MASNSFSNTEAGDNGQSEMTAMTRDRLRRPDWAFHNWSGRFDKTSANDDDGSERDWKCKNV